MIRINLIRDRTVIATRPTIEPEITRLGLLMGILFFANTMLFGWWFWSLKSEREDKLKEREKLRAESVRLQAIHEKVKDYEKQKAQLEERIGIIERLKENQIGPVELLSKVKASVPDPMWLTSLSQAASTINIEGNFLEESALPLFIKNLEGTRHFSTVDLVFYETGKESNKFALRCQVTGKR